MFKTVNQYLLFVPAIIIMVAELIKAFEVAGNGEAKRNAVLDAVDMAYDELAKVAEIKVSKEFVQAVAEKSITIIVNFYNLIGLFKKEGSN